MKWKFNLLNKKAFISISFLAFTLCSKNVGAECFYPVTEFTEPCHCFNIHADFLYWQPTVSNLPFGATVDANVTTTLITASESLYHIQFDYQPGFRIGGAWTFDCGWDLAIDWTRLHTSKSDSIIASEDELFFVVPVWFATPLETLSINATQDLKYDLVTIDFVKNISLGNSFAFRPFFGPIGTFIHQSLKLDNIVTDEEEGTGSQDIVLENKFDGGGLRIGLESEYLACSWFSIYGKGSWALAYGDFTLNQTYNTPITTIIANFDRKEKAVITGFDIMAGVRGTFSICGCEIMAHVSYEFVLWPEQVRLQELFFEQEFPPHTQTFRGNGDIGFQGLTTGLAISF